MRLNLLFLLFIFSFFGFCQEAQDSIYFPQEMLVHSECAESSDTNECLERILEKQLLKIITKPLKKGRINKDTLTIKVSLDIDGFGYLIQNRSYISVNEKDVNKNQSKAFEKILKKLPNFKVLNLKNPIEYYVSHNFQFNYLAKNVTSIEELILLNIPKYKYTGGEIIEAPLFPGCIKSSESANRKCFNTKIQEHIAANFHYPKIAENNGIQGRVNIMFTIDKNGKYTNIKSRGPHQILVEEAERIISTLPHFEPGMSNGKPVKVPFSIPITFRLQ